MSQINKQHLCVSRERDAEEKAAPLPRPHPSAREEMLLNSLPKVKRMLGWLKSRLRLAALGKHLRASLPGKGMGTFTRHRARRPLRRQSGEHRGSDAEAQFLGAAAPVPEDSYKRALLTWDRAEV